MKGFLILGALAGACYLGWRAGGNLDTDAMGMAVGIVLGALAAIPTALLLLASGRRRDAEAAERRRRSRRQGGNHGTHPNYLDGRSASYGGYAPQQPPVIVLAGVGPQPGNTGMMNGQGYGGWGENRPERRFKLVGEQEAWIDD